MNLTTMRARLRKIIGNPDTASVPDADLTECINEAYMDIVDEFRFRAVRELATFPTVASTNAYTLPANHLVLMGLRDCTNNRELLKREYDWIKQQSFTSNGMPLYYARFEDFIYLYPTPDAIYTIELYYRLLPVELSADADIPVIPTPWHRGIVRFARYKYYDSIGNVEKAKYAWATWQGWISNKPSEVDEEQFYEGDVGVRVPTLEPVSPKLDFDHSD